MAYNAPKDSAPTLVPFTKKDMYAFYSKQKFGLLRPIVKHIISFFGRLIGVFSYQDRINIACYCDPPKFFINKGLQMSHPYGVTLSADEIGCDCVIGQNATIGTNGRNMRLEEYVKSPRPKIGNLVRIYPHAVISGEIKIGDCVIIAASSIVTKNIPNKSIVYGVNQIKSLDTHHVEYLKAALYFCCSVYKKVPGLMYKDNKMYINTEYLRKRTLLIKSLKEDTFSALLNELF